MKLTRRDLRAFLIEELKSKDTNEDDSKWLETLLDSFPVDSYVILDFLNLIVNQKKYEALCTQSLSDCLSFLLESKWDVFKSRISHLFNEEHMKREQVVKELSRFHLATEKLIQKGIQELVDENAIEYTVRDCKTPEGRKEFYETIKYYYEEHPEMTMQDIADKLGKTNSYIRFMIHDLRKKGLITDYRNEKTLYTRDEDEFLVGKRAQNWPYEAIGSKLGRTAQSVKQRFYYLYYNHPNLYNEFMVKAISEYNNTDSKERMVSYA